MIRARRVFDLKSLNGTPELLGDFHDLVRRVGCQQNDEFLASEATELATVLRDDAFHGVRYSHEARVTFLMAVEVVVHLEIIDIDQDDRERSRPRFPLAPKLLQEVVG